MYKDKKILAVIPARGGSKGLPGKNIKLLNGKPLIAWSIIEAKKSIYIDRTIVSTDSQEIADVAKEFGADVPFLRPDELARDSSSSADALLHAVNFLESQGDKFDFIVLIEPTSPLREVKDIDEPLKQLVDHESAKAVVSICKLESEHPDFAMFLRSNGLTSPFLGEGGIIAKRRQDLKDLYFPDGTIYISDIDFLKLRKTVYHEFTLGFPVARYKHFEVDEAMDMVIMESLMKFRENGGLKITNE